MIDKSDLLPGHHYEAINGLSRTASTHADVSERLLMEFGPTHGLRLVSEVLRRCRIELATGPAPSSPTALERLARAMMLTAPVPVPRTKAS